MYVHLHHLLPNQFNPISVNIRMPISDKAPLWLIGSWNTNRYRLENVKSGQTQFDRNYTVTPVGSRFYSLLHSSAFEQGERETAGAVKSSSRVMHWTANSNLPAYPHVHTSPQYSYSYSNSNPNQVSDPDLDSPNWGHHLMMITNWG